MSPPRTRTPPAGVPVFQPARAWARVLKLIAAFGGPPALAALIWGASSVVSARPTTTEVDRAIEIHATRPHVETDARLRAVEAHQAAVDAKLEWIVDTMRDDAARRGIPTRPVPAPVEP